MLELGCLWTGLGGDLVHRWGGGCWSASSNLDSTLDALHSVSIFLDMEASFLVNFSAPGY